MAGTLHITSGDLAGASLAPAAIRDGKVTPGQIFALDAAADTPPQYWGDTTLWAKINGLADRVPPWVRIDGPAARLPQWASELRLENFKITALPEPVLSQDGQWLRVKCLGFKHHNSRT